MGKHQEDEVMTRQARAVITAGLSLTVLATASAATGAARSPVARDTLAVRRTLPLTGCVKDFHLQLSAPCRAHQQEARRCYLRASIESVGGWMNVSASAD
jgi:hypothetical protein